MSGENEKSYELETSLSEVVLLIASVDIKSPPPKCISRTTVFNITLLFMLTA